MGVKIKTNKDELYKMYKDFKWLDDKKVQVGVFGGTHQWLAPIHEYGLDIAVTDKMRGWLGAHGLHLKKSTMFIHIPERSFLRSGFDEYHQKALQQAERAISTGVIEFDKILNDIIGSFLMKKIKKFATDLESPPNHPFTIENKNGKANPLMASNDMVEGISYRVER